MPRLVGRRVIFICPNDDTYRTRGPIRTFCAGPLSLLASDPSQRQEICFTGPRHFDISQFRSKVEIPVVIGLRPKI
jgi:hypothetical protein